MKIIKYKLCTRVNYGTEETPEWVDILDDKEIHCTADNLSANEEIAKAEAYNGEYTIEDDGQPEPTPTPTTDYATYEELAEAFSQGVDSI